MFFRMQIHGLITQPGLKEIIGTNLQVKPSVKIVRGVEFQFVYHTKVRFFGYRSTWINQHDKVAVSELESRAILPARPLSCIVGRVRVLLNIK